MKKKAQMETLETSEEGNTRTSSARISPGKYWCFVFNNYTEEQLETLETRFKKAGVLYFFEREIGKKEGTPHLQGFIKCKDKIRPTEKFKFTEIHWEKTIGDKNSNVVYCSKDLNDIRTNMIIKRKLKDPLEGKDLYDWQKEILEILDKEADDRKIYWYWEPTGKVGKTSFAKSYIIKNPYTCLMLSGKASDIKYGVQNFISNEDNDLRTCIFHYVRSQEDFISYEALESIKDGIFYSGKYESGMVVFNTPHIIVFSNFEPDESKMSLDRWIVKRIGEPVVRLT